MAEFGRPATVRSYKDLEVWWFSMDLVVAVYEFAATLPTEERFALANQLRRSAVSIPSNIAEGFGRHHTQDFVRLLHIVQGSTKELETQHMISVRAGYASESHIEDMLTTLDRTGKMLRSLARSLQERDR